MISAISAVLGSGISTPALTLSALSDVFEAYVWSLVIQAARIEGASIWYENVNENPVTSLVFRTSPGHIYSTAQPYSHAVIEFPDKPHLEAHIGVRVAGKSGVLHESDVLVIQRSEALTCRSEKVPPRSSKLLIAVECKFYGSLLQLGLARSFLGLVTDFSAEESFFVTNTSSESVERLLARRGKNWENDISPACPSEVERLLNAFKGTFKNFKAK